MKEFNDNYGFLFQILGAAGVLAAFYYFTPILDLLYMFAIVVVIPLTFLAAVGLLSEGMYDAIVRIPAGISAYSAQVKDHAAKIREQNKTQAA